MAAFDLRLLVRGALDLLWRLAGKSKSKSQQEREHTLRSLLRRFPYWPAGHRELALLSLEQDNIALAYSSAVIYEMISREDSTSRREGLLILGRCFLKRGDSHRALSYFEQARLLGLNTPQLTEEVAAAHILSGSYQEALESLSRIPSELLSAEGKAALSFVRSKQHKEG